MTTSVSFYQQDLNYWSKAHAQSQVTAANNALINVMGQAEVNKAKGLASIANGQALTRTNNQITALVQQVLQGSSSSSSSNSSSSKASTASGSTSSSSSTTGSAATGTGTVVLSTSTSLSTLGILPGGTITVGTGANITTYTSTGTDTIADLINAINIDLPTNANVVASLNTRGQLVLTSRDKTSAIFVGGSGTDANAIGFGLANNTFLSTAPSKTASTSASATASSSSSTSQSSQTASSSSSSKPALPSYLAYIEQGASTAASILGASGVSGTLVDLLS
jgi:hypothetical protein